MKKKIGLIGGGNIGGTLAYIIASKALGDIVILDRNKGYAEGKALDVEESLPIIKKDLSIIGTDNYKDIEGADLVIITAGVARRPGMTRDDLLSVNADVMSTVAQGVKKYASDAFVIVITNPLDAMAYAFLEYSAFPKNKVVGMAGVLDSARFRLFLARELNMSVQDITTLVLGGHGDTMVPLIKYTSIGGVPLEHLIEKGIISYKTVEAIIERTRNGGLEIIQLLKTSSAFYAPAISAIEMAESYLEDKKQLLPCSVLLEGEYGISDICMGVPVIIGKEGIEGIVEISFDKNESAMFQKSAEAVKELIITMKKFLN